MKTNRNLAVTFLATASLLVTACDQDESTDTLTTTNAETLLKSTVTTDELRSLYIADPLNNQQTIGDEINLSKSNAPANVQDVPADIGFLNKAETINFPKKMLIHFDLNEVSKLSKVGKNFILSNVASKTQKDIRAVYVGGVYYLKSNNASEINRIPLKVRRLTESKGKEFPLWGLSSDQIRYEKSRIIVDEWNRIGRASVNCNNTSVAQSDVFVTTETTTKETNWNVSGSFSLAVEKTAKVPFIASAKITATVTIGAGGGGSTSNTKSIQYRANLNAPAKRAVELLEFSRNFETENDFSYEMEFDGYVQYIYKEGKNYKRGHINVWDALFSERNKAPNHFTVTGVAKQSSNGDRIYVRNELGKTKKVRACNSPASLNQ